MLAWSLMWGGGGSYIAWGSVGDDAPPPHAAENLAVGVDDAPLYLVPLALDPGVLPVLLGEGDLAAVAGSLVSDPHSPVVLDRQLADNDIVDAGGDLGPDVPVVVLVQVDAVLACGVDLNRPPGELVTRVDAAPVRPPADVCWRVVRYSRAKY
jgi:hypothetical protein